MNMSSIIYQQIDNSVDFHETLNYSIKENEVLFINLTRTKRILVI